STLLPEKLLATPRTLMTVSRPSEGRLVSVFCEDKLFDIVRRQQIASDGDHFGRRLMTRDQEIIKINTGVESLLIRSLIEKANHFARLEILNIIRRVIKSNNADLSCQIQILDGFCGAERATSRDINHL